MSCLTRIHPSHTNRYTVELTLSTVPVPLPGTGINARLEDTRMQTVLRILNLV
jgi:hypothetical protein